MTHRANAHAGTGRSPRSYAAAASGAGPLRQPRGQYGVDAAVGAAVLGAAVLACVPFFVQDLFVHLPSEAHSILPSPTYFSSHLTLAVAL